MDAREICAKYPGRGQAVYVEGIILNRAYEHNGERKYVTEVRAYEVTMLMCKENIVWRASPSTVLPRSGTFLKRVS